MWKRVLIQKMQIINTLLMNVGTIAFLEIFGGIVYLTLIVKVWLPIIAPQVALEILYPRVSLIWVILLSLVFLFMLWAVRSYIAALFSSLGRLLQVLVVTSYIQRDSLPVPPHNTGKAKSITGTFEPYTALDPKEENLKTVFSNFFWLLVLAILLYWVGGVALKEFSLPENTIVQYISLAIFFAVQLLFICFSGKKKISV